MTQEELRRIRDLRGELELLKTQIEELDSTINRMTSRISDMPKGSAADISELLARYVDLSDRIRLQERACHESYISAVEYINGLSDSYMRQILSYRYLEGYSWVKVAMLVNGTEASVKMAAKRFFEKE